MLENEDIVATGTSRMWNYEIGDTKLMIWHRYPGCPSSSGSLCSFHEWLDQNGKSYQYVPEIEDADVLWHMNIDCVCQSTFALDGAIKLKGPFQRKVGFYVVEYWIDGPNEKIWMHYKIAHNVQLVFQISISFFKSGQFSHEWAMEDFIEIFRLWDSLQFYIGDATMFELPPTTL